MEDSTFTGQLAVLLLLPQPANGRYPVRSGENGEGPSLDVGVRQLLATAYLKPLRDAEREMSPGRNSRLSQVLKAVFPILTLAIYLILQHFRLFLLTLKPLSIAGMGDYSPLGEQS